MSSIKRSLSHDVRVARASFVARSTARPPRELTARLAGGALRAPEPGEVEVVPDPLARAALVAGMAERVLSAWLAQPRQGPTPAQGGLVTLHLAVEIDTAAAQAGTARGIRILQLGAGSPQATAWQAGFLDARAGRVPSFSGPAELEGDYWTGVDAAVRHAEG